MLKWLSEKMAALLAIAVFIVLQIFIRWDEGKYWQSILISAVIIFIILICYYTVKFFIGLFF
jgi:hypothetical protein